MKIDSMEHYVENAIVTYPEALEKGLGHILWFPSVKDLTKSIFERMKEMKKEKSRSFIMHAGLAHSFGTSLPKSIRRIDDKSKILISGVMRMLNERLKKNDNAPVTWTFLESAMMNFEMLESLDMNVGTKTSFFTYADRPWVRLDGTADPEFIERTKMWWESFTCEEEIAEDMGLDAEALTEMVGDMGPRVAAMLTAISDKCTPLIDDFNFGVIRFPTQEKDDVKISWIRVFTRHEMSRSDTEGNFIRVDYISRRFKARDDILKNFGKSIVQLSRKDVNALVEVYAQ